MPSNYKHFIMLYCIKIVFHHLSPATPRPLPATHRLSVVVRHLELVTIPPLPVNIVTCISLRRSYAKKNTGKCFL